MEMISKIRADFQKVASQEKAKLLMRFFKTSKGEYGEGDKFLGVMVPETRVLIKKYGNRVGYGDIEKLMDSEFHEERLLGLLILVEWYGKRKDERERVKNFYLKHLSRVNNWDLVDLSAPKILGRWVYENGESELLERMAESLNLWERRVAVLSSFWFIGQGEAGVSLKLAAKLLGDKEDLMHKAVGWMLREVGKRVSQETEEEFLKSNYKKMPRTMLRYAIERFEVEKRKWYLGLK